MARLARGDVFDPFEISTFHCINRCVRRCFLCGHDPVSGKNFNHRKRWLEERLRFLAGIFGIDVLGFAILSNHFHLVLRNRPDVVASWSDQDVARHWLRLCPVRKTDAGAAEEPTDQEIAAITGAPERLAEIRLRLSHISWFMRMIAEPIARQANREDQTGGRFWQGRFRTVKLCDEAALLACSVYVDLNPIRAGLAATLEASDFTSAQRRIEARQTALPKSAAESGRARTETRAPDDWLTPLPLQETTTLAGPAPSISRRRCSDKGFLPLSLDEYLTLLDWTGRQHAAGKRGAIPADLAPILTRLGIETSGWLRLTQDFGRLFRRVAGGCPALERERSRRTGQRFRLGQARLLGPPPS